mmetsp:Transcript_29475/g.66041  ORF Transcript_29475/g.66041 Transcript_29475/m.66041 type:complete len:323 (-) Transcript_29475:2015-2983(-)
MSRLRRQASRQVLCRRLSRRTLHRPNLRPSQLPSPRCCRRCCRRNHRRRDLRLCRHRGPLDYRHRTLPCPLLGLPLICRRRLRPQARAPMPSLTVARGLWGRLGRLRRASCTWPTSRPCFEPRPARRRQASRRALRFGTIARIGQRRRAWPQSTARSPPAPSSSSSLIDLGVTGSWWEVGRLASTAQSRFTSPAIQPRRLNQVLRRRNRRILLRTARQGHPGPSLQRNRPRFPRRHRQSPQRIPLRTFRPGRRRRPLATCPSRCQAGSHRLCRRSGQATRPPQSRPSCPLFIRQVSQAPDPLFARRLSQRTPRPASRGLPRP